MGKEVRVNRLKTDSWIGISSFADSKTAIFLGIDSKSGNKKNIFSSVEERIEFEKELGLKEGELLPTSPFWNTFSVILNEGTCVLDMDIPEHRLQYKLLLSKANVGLSSDILSNKKEFVIYDEEAEAKEVNKLRKMKKDAFAFFAQMSQVDLANYLIATGKKVSNTSPEIIEQQVGDDVEKKPDFFLSIVKKPNYKNIIFFNKLVHADIVNKKPLGYFYNDFSLGRTIDDAVEYLNDKKNADVLVGLKQEFEALKIK